MSKGQKIKELREKNKMTQEQLATKLGTSKQTIFKYENGIVTNIPSDKVEMMAKIFHVSPAYIMDWDDPEKEYYLDPEVAEMAQELYSRPEMRVLFDATKNVSKDDIQFVIDMLDRMKK
ncbi:MAG: helix-turn-helix transcriptional regulator [Firmicutes bacterium]|nr:helix-turn-helix transcriptional regulator [Bacillota bacterium]MDY5856264.1 helix-turn-helix transcriptional regulator [Anaerovoracaceae bacterium]